MKRKCILAAALCAALLPANTAKAQVIDQLLTRENQPAFCERHTNQRYYVNTKNLADALLGEVGLGPTAVATAVGTTDARAILSLLLEARDETGRYPSLETNPLFKKGLKELYDEATYINAFIRNAREGVNGYLDQGYVVIADKEVITYLDLFSPLANTTTVPTVSIECIDVGKKPQQDQKKSGFLQDFGKSVGSVVRLNGKVQDLAKPRAGKKLLGLSTADVAYKDNKAAGADTFSINGALGLDLTTKAGFKLIPFVEYNQSKTSKSAGTTEVEVLSTGIMASKLFASADFAVLVNLTPRYTLDFAQNSEQISIEGSIDPAFDLFEIPIGVYSYLGPMLVRPELIFSFQGDYVLDPGTNPKLLDKDDFFRLGGVASVNLRFPDVPIISSFQFDFAYEWYHFISSPLDTLQRKEIKVSYNLGDTTNYVVSFAYVDGRNKLSLQKEEYWGVTFGARF